MNKAVENWLNIQSHKWLERNKKRIAILNLTGHSLPIEPFPVSYSLTREGEIYIWDKSYEVAKLDFDAWESAIWGEHNEGSNS